MMTGFCDAARALSYTAMPRLQPLYRGDMNMTCTQRCPTGPDADEVSEANDLLDRLEGIFQRFSGRTLSPSCVDAVLFLRHELQAAARQAMQPAGL
ncbi:MAG: hypothetical protein IT449_08980 [Phycisphaerales bacterium]|nr:hypothetical protein [Phycisphaerales bacterium]